MPYIYQGFHCWAASQGKIARSERGRQALASHVSGLPLNQAAPKAIDAGLSGKHAAMLRLDEPDLKNGAQVHVLGGVKQRVLARFASKALGNSKRDGRGMFVRKVLNRVLPGLLLASLAVGAQAAPRYESLTLAGPGAVVSYPLMHMAQTQALSQYTDKLEFRLWQNPDQLRVLLAKKEVDYSAAPSNLSALMFNKGQAVKQLNISVWGILWLVSRDPAVKSFSDLAGQELLVPFQRDLPAVLLDTLLAKQAEPGKEAVRLRRTRDAQDAIALMLTGQGDQALLVEPTASLLLWQAEQKKVELHRGQSLEQAWAEVFPSQQALPQAGVMANVTVAHDTELNQAVERAYAESARWCSQQPQECAQMVHGYLPQFPVPAIQTAIEKTRLDSRPASEIRPQLEALYQLLADQHPQALGGGLPAAGFYGP